MQAFERFPGREGTVGIHADLDLPGGVPGADAGEEFEFALEVDGADLDLDAAESLPEFVLEAKGHLLEIAHPDQSVDGNAVLAIRKGGGEVRFAPQLGFQPAQGRLQSEADRRVVGPLFRAGRFAVGDPAAQFLQAFSVIGAVVARKASEYGAFAHRGVSRVGEGEKPGLLAVQHSARGAGGFLEEKPVGKTGGFQVHALFRVFR